MHELSALRTIASTGSPLGGRKLRLPLHRAGLSSMIYDIISCFVLGRISRVARRDPDARPRPQGRSVGQQWRSAPGREGRAGLHRALTSSFSNNSDEAEYRAAYFKKFSNVWCHGDYVELTEHDSIIVYGRSDTTLNPGGVRCARPRSIARSNSSTKSRNSHWPRMGERHRVVPSSCCAPGRQLDEMLVQKINGQIRANTTPRHIRQVVSPTYHAPGAARSSSSPCATLFTAARLRTAKPLPTPRSRGPVGAASVVHR